MTQTTIDVETLRSLLNQGEPVTVLDIRHNDEHDEWTIPGSVHVDAYDALKSGDPNALDGVDLPGETPVVTVCNVGKTSAIAAEQLRARGLRSLSLAGGMKAWSLAWNSAEAPVPNSDARIIQVRRTGKGCLSYIVASEGEAAVIDAALSTSKLNSEEDGSSPGARASPHAGRMPAPPGELVLESSANHSLEVLRTRGLSGYGK